MRSLGLPELLVVLLLFSLIGFPFWRIARKMGYPGIIGLGAVVPLLNLILLYFLAFSDWPALRQRRID